MNPDAVELEHVLRQLGAAERAYSEKAYLKIDLEFAGVSVPKIRSAVAQWCRDRANLDHADLDRADLDHGSLDHDRLTAAASALWASNLFESRLAAEIMLERKASLLEAGDIVLIEHLLRRSAVRGPESADRAAGAGKQSGTWALVDGLACNVAGELAERYPAEIAPVLDRWAKDPDFWIRRSALLALLRPLRRGQGDFDRFATYADAMLEEKEFFIRKAIGWVLRETAKRRPELVASWLAPRVHRASGVTVREAGKPLPPPVRDQLLAGYREKRPVEAPVMPGT